MNYLLITVHILLVSSWVMDPRKISIEEYSYDLPEERIATYPKEERDRSKLLIYHQHEINEDIFKNIASHLTPGSLIVFNNTRVVEARIFFQKPTGAKIEIFCLEPGDEYADPASALSATGAVTWKCLVGNAASWNKGLVLEKKFHDHVLRAEMISRQADHFLISLSWQPSELSFAEILHEAGLIPLPPYIKRQAEYTDTERYQTVYAEHTGSVAAPTAGLHFTERILKELTARNITKDFVTLHVGAGTFKPVKAATMSGHEMHAEYIEIKISLVENLFKNIGNPIIAVGTTSLRTLESIYWLGRKILFNDQKLFVQQWEPYIDQKPVPVKEALAALIQWMKNNNLKTLVTKTSLLIAPPYEFKIADTLITNFHQPRSTLLLLVAAFTGKNWKSIYQYALEKDFRFLSYGDACLLFRH